MKAKLIIIGNGSIYRVPLKTAERIAVEMEERETAGLQNDENPDMSDLIEAVERNGRYMGEVFTRI